MILTLYTENIIYTSEVRDKNDYSSDERIVIHSCGFEQTGYGSVKVQKPDTHTIIEFYPSSIKHIIHH